MTIRIETIVLILLSVALSSAAQLLLKTGMSAPGLGPTMGERRWTELLPLVFGNGWVLLGLATYFLSAVVWLAVLARVQVSFAYPFVGIGFILTMLLGWWLMGDSLNGPRVAGTLLIASGVALIAVRG
jgi:multidrug transporter EmrE-like cation transporter